MFQYIKNIINMKMQNIQTLKHLVKYLYTNKCGKNITL